MRYWQLYKLAPLKCLGPPLASPLKKAIAASVQDIANTLKMVFCKLTVMHALFG